MPSYVIVGNRRSPPSASVPTAFQGKGAKCQHFVECVATASPAAGGMGLPWEPFRPWGLVSEEGIRLQPCPGWASCKVGEGVARGGLGTAAPSGEERAAEKEARLDFAVSSGRASKAGLVAWCGRGCGGARLLPGRRAHPYLQALQRKTNDSLNVVSDSPGLSPGPASGAGGPG